MPTMPSSTDPTASAQSQASGLQRAAIGAGLWLWRQALERPGLYFGLLLSLLILPTLWSRHLWPNDELRHAAVFWEMISQGNYFALSLNGELYPDKPPIYFWLLGAVSFVTQSSDAWIFFLTVGLTAAFMAWVTFLLARDAAQMGREGAVVSVLVLLSTFYFVDRAHFPRMDLLFASFMALSLRSFAMSFRDRDAQSPVALGIVYATLAALTKGPLGFGFPVIAFLVTLLLAGQLGRAVSRRMIVGLALSAGLVALYAAGTWAEAGWDYLAAVASYSEDRSGLLGRGSGVWLYLGWMAPNWMPWTLVLLVLPWGRLLAALPGAVRPRGDAAASGRLLLGVYMVLVFAVLSAMQYRLQFFQVIFLPPLSVAIAGAVLLLSDLRWRLFATGLGALLMLAGLVMPVVSRMPSIGVIVENSVLQGAVAALVGGALILVARAGLRPSLAVLSVGVTLVVLPHFLISYPQTGSDTKAAFDEAARAAIADGAAPMGYRITAKAGYYQYPLRSRLEMHRTWPELNAALVARDGAVVVVLNQSDWKGWPDRPPEAVIAAETQLRRARFVRQLPLYLVAIPAP
ncbi:MAG: glycosyltransferase family 39 protein [Pseudomonadota bacterium]